MEPLNVVLVGTPNGRAVQLQANRTLYAEGAFVAWSATEAAAPLFEALFAAGGGNVESLYAADNFVTLVLLPEAEPEAHALGTALRNAFIEAWPATDIPQLPPPNRYQADVSARAEIFRQQILPATHQHGGALYLVEDGGTNLTLEALGACRGCPYAPETVEKGILNPLRNVYPDLAQVLVR